MVNRTASSSATTTVTPVLSDLRAQIHPQAEAQPADFEAELCWLTSTLSQEQQLMPAECLRARATNLACRFYLHRGHLGDFDFVQSAYSWISCLPELTGASQAL